MLTVRVVTRKRPSGHQCETNSATTYGRNTCWAEHLAEIAAIAMSSCFSIARAQDIKLYAFSSGALTIGKGILQNSTPVEPPIQIPVGFFVIKHPKGNVLFDTGNNDRNHHRSELLGRQFQCFETSPTRRTWRLTRS